ncbi:MAG: transporter permease [Mycobacterium sp.]|jgi:ABC-type nitrate/sulfonate/bicarbonate transport system permease component|nr:transporter permease [Mycobacterium sp.]
MTTTLSPRVHPARSSARADSPLPRYTRRLVALAVVAVLWQISASVLGPDTLPGVWPCLSALVQALVTGPFWAATASTALSTLIGLAIAVVVAVPVGAVIGSVELADRSTRVLVDVLRTIPPITLLPLVLLLYGPTLQMSLVLVVYGAFWPMLLHSIYAIRDIEPVQRDVAAAFGLPTGVRWRTLVLPSVLPMVLVGVRVSATIALLMSVAAELVGGAPGVGAEITNAQVAGQTDTAYVYVICAALLGIGINSLMRLVERKAISWHPSVRNAVRTRGAAA